MPLIPERLRSRQDVKASIGSQFWEQPVHSTKSVDGQLWSLPCEPPALNLTGSSGLSRTQQLLATQAVRVPFFPSYDGSSDGLVRGSPAAALRHSPGPAISRCRRRRSCCPPNTTRCTGSCVYCPLWLRLCLVMQVLDRVLANSGGQRWWAALSGRIKAQRMYKLAASGKASKARACCLAASWHLLA